MPRKFIGKNYSSMETWHLEIVKKKNTHKALTYKSDCMTVNMSRFMVNEWTSRIPYGPVWGNSLKKRCTWKLVVDSITIFTTRYRPSFSPSGRTVRLSRATTIHVTSRILWGWRMSRRRGINANRAEPAVLRNTKKEITELCVGRL